MSFGEKLFMLRKERGFSQEELAEKVGTTRQAVSRWENNQGFPEIEKLIMLGNVFDVTTDYLLKDDVVNNETNHKGYYVSNEKAEAWILHEQQNIKKLATGIAILICSGIPFLIFRDYVSVALLIGFIFILIGIVCICNVCFTDNDYEFKVLKQKELLFDHTFYETLKGKYTELKKKYIIMMIVLPVSVILGIAGYVIGHYFKLSLTFIFPLYLGILAIGVSMFLYGSTMIDTYELLVYNEEYMRRFSTRLLLKIRNIIDRILK